MAQPLSSASSRWQPAKWQAYCRLMRIDRPIGALLLAWPTLWALVAASGGWPDLKVLVIMMAGVAVMRAAGCVINDYADRKVDGFVKRTCSRPLVSGDVTSKEAIRLFVILMVAALLLVLMLNPLTIALSVVGALLAICYPFMKRVTYLPQFVLGLAFSWSIPMAWAAQSGDLPGQVWWLFAANILWTIAYDTLYAMVDRDDDVKVGIKSTAILFGRYDLLMVALLQLATLGTLVAFGWQLALGSLYWLGLVVAAGCFVHQLWLARYRERDPCFRAFMLNNRVGTAILIGISGSMLF